MGQRKGRSVRKNKQVKSEININIPYRTVLGRLDVKKCIIFLFDIVRTYGYLLLFGIRCSAMGPHPLGSETLCRIRNDLTSRIWNRNYNFRTGSGLLEEKQEK